MTEPSIAVPSSKGPRRWLRRLGFIGGGLLGVLIVLYFVGTSTAFLKSFILPRVGSAMNATITVEDANLSPFSSVALTGLKVVTTGSEPLLTAKEVRTGYSLTAMLGGNIKVNEVSLVSPVVNIAEGPDGRSNLDPLFAGSKKNEKKKPSSKPPQLDVKNVKLENATLRFVKVTKDGQRLFVELANVNLSLDQLRNAAATKLTLGAEIKAEQGKGGTNDTLQAKLAANFDLALSADLQPQTIKGRAEIGVAQALGAFKDLAGLTAALDGDVTPTEIKQTALSFTQNGKVLGQLKASGPLDLAKHEGKVKVELVQIDRQLLNTVGAPFELDFGATTVIGASQIDLTKGGMVVNASGQLQINRFSVTQKGQTTPTLDLKLDYQAGLDRDKELVSIQTLALNATQNQRPLLRGTLAGPMTLSIGTNSVTASVSDSAFDLTVTGLNLADWRAFAPDIAAQGSLDLTLKLLAQQAGRKLDMNLDTQLRNFSAKLGSNQVNQAGLTVAVRGQIEDLKRINLSDASVKAAWQKQPVVSASVSGQVNSETQEADLRATLDGSLPQFAALLGRNDFKASSGTVQFNGRMARNSSKPGSTKPSFTQNVTGSLKLANVTGDFAGSHLDRFAVGAECDVEVKGDSLQIRKLGGDVTSGGQPGGSFDVTGQFDLKKQAGQAAVKLVDLNQNALRPFVEPALGGGKRLTSISVSTSLNARHDAKGDSSVKGDLQIARLVIADPEKKLPDVPLTTTLKLDGSFAQSRLELRQLDGKAIFGTEPAGSFSASGSFDSKQGRGQGAFKLADLNQNTLRPFLAGALGDRSLVSVTINASGTARYDAKGESALKTDFSVTNLVVNDPKNPALRTPLSAQFVVDGGIKKQVADLRQFQLALSPTARAKNQFNLAGKVDMTDTNAAAATLKLSADSLDLTPFYDLFDDPKKVQATNAPVAAAATPSSNAEPVAVKLPLRQSSFDVNIGRLFLREIAVSNLTLAARVDGGRVQVKPLSLMINGAPVSASADLDLGVPGFQYDVGFSAQKIPVEPLANTFSPVYRGQAQGDLYANLQLKGAGVTGRNLQKSLSGQAAFTFTNANISIVSPKWRPVLLVIATAVQVPQITRSPINYLSADLAAGSGQLDIRRFIAHSDAFIAESRGKVPLRDVLNDSPFDQPVDVSLPNSLAKRFKSSGTGPKTGYMKLFPFVTLKGTLGKPDPKVNYAGLGLATVEGVAGGLGGKAGDAVQGVIGIGKALTGQKPAEPTDPAATNNPPANAQTNKPSPFDLLPFLKKKK
jgi:hypothetical protein